MNLQDQSLLKQASFVNGQWVKSTLSFEVDNPYDRSTIAEVPDMTAEEAEEAIDAAHKAFQKWRKTTAGERAKLLRNWYNLHIEHQDDLAMILSMEQGKPLAEAKGEIAYGASFIEWFAEEARRSYGDVIPGHQADKRILTIKQPVGVVTAITPWNFPNAMIARKAAPALAAGCTMVVKPAEATPLSALAMAELARRAGIPDGVFNVITTQNAAEVGKVLTTHPLVRKVTFTGSTAVGKILLRQSAGTVKRVSMELGGNAPFIVFDDADVDEAVAGAIQAKYRNAGQTCVCANRLYVQDAIYEEFVEKLAEAIQALKVGSGQEVGVDIGPLINEEALSFVDDVVRDALEKGACLKLGGKRGEPNENFYQPTLLTEVDDRMKVHSEEIFGPVAPVFRFDSEDQVTKSANDTPYGLAAYFYTRDNSRIWRVSEALEYGMVGINTGLISTPVAPFGGIKESGMGREGSKYGMDEYQEIKYVCQSIQL